MTTDDVTHIGSRRELFVDDYLIADKSGGARLRLHKPVPREVVLVTDRPWEGNMSGYVTLFRDENRLRMYYKAWQLDLKQSSDDAGPSGPHPLWVCYAESNDGLSWRRPELGLIEYQGSRTNNVVWQGKGEKQHGVHGFSPFKDANPDTSPAARYKAVGGDRRATQGHLYAMASPDGIHWSLLQQEPIMRQDVHGAFDSQNLAFWDTVRGEYRIYVRDFHQYDGGRGMRDIKTATSPDFYHWTDPVWLNYGGAPHEQLYTNQVQPYYRAPHIYIGFPTRYVERSWGPAVEQLPELEHRRRRAEINERYGTALTEGLFMTSRDGRTFKRWEEAFIPPGPQLEGNWAYGDNYQCRGMFEAPSPLSGAPPELSFLAEEGAWRGKGKRLRRYSMRIDGFVSLHGPRSGATMTTKPFTFRGDALALNVATSAAGSIRVEIREASGEPIEGFSLDDCHEVIGDELERIVRWREGAELSALAGHPIRLHFVLCDADLYSMRFVERT